MFCRGQNPNSTLVKSLDSNLISSTDHRIRVRPTLQLSRPDNIFTHTFALGDVAESGGPQMGRAGYVQAQIVNDNLIRLIQGRRDLRVYRPDKAMEGAIKLTLGKAGH